MKTLFLLLLALATIGGSYADTRVGAFPTQTVEDTFSKPSKAIPLPKDDVYDHWRSYWWGQFVEFGDKTQAPDATFSENARQGYDFVSNIFYHKKAKWALENAATRVGKATASVENMVLDTDDGNEEEPKEDKACNPLIDETDKFTGIHQVFWGDKVLDNAIFSDKQQFAYIYYGQYGDTLMLQLQITKLVNESDMHKYDEIIMDMKARKGQKMYFALANGKPLALTATYDSKIRKGKALSTYNITMIQNYTFTKEQLLLLSESLITDVGIELEAITRLDGKVRPKDAAALQAKARCAYDKLFGQ